MQVFWQTQIYSDAPFIIKQQWLTAMRFWFSWFKEEISELATSKAKEYKAKANKKVNKAKKSVKKVVKKYSTVEEKFKDQPDLDEIASAINLSKYHFHRLFKRWAGVTPNQFLQYLTHCAARAWRRRTRSSCPSTGTPTKSSCRPRLAGERRQ